MRFLYVVVTFLVFNGAVQAAMVAGSVSGEITFADSGNDFGLLVGDSVQLDVSYDDSVLSGIGGETVFSVAPVTRWSSLSPRVRLISRWIMLAGLVRRYFSLTVLLVK